MGNPLTAVPMKAARWSAEHPWRAILGWIAFVAIAVGLAIAIPAHEATDADFRIGESGRADAIVAEAGPAQFVEQGADVVLDGTASAGHAASDDAAPSTSRCPAAAFVFSEITKWRAAWFP